MINFRSILSSILNQRFCCSLTKLRFWNDLIRQTFYFGSQDCNVIFFIPNAINHLVLKIVVVWLRNPKLTTWVLVRQKKNKINIWTSKINMYWIGHIKIFQTSFNKSSKTIFPFSEKRKPFRHLDKSGLLTTFI